MSEHLPTRSEALNFLAQVGCPPNVIKHSEVVASYAIKIANACLKNGRKVDVQLVEVGALLHDIGRSKTHSVDHALLGGRIVRSMRLPNPLVRVVERHVGGGIPKNEAKRLGWPSRDYLPQTLEEKIVCYADKRVQGLQIVSIKRTLKVYAGNLGNNHPALERIEQLHRDISAIVGHFNADSDIA